MRIAQLANFIGPASGGMKTAVQAIGQGYADAGVARLLVIPGPEDAVDETAHGRVVQVRAPRVGGGYRMIVEPWRVTAALEDFGPTSIELNDKTTLMPVARWARKNGVHAVLFSHERMDHMLAMRTGFDTAAKASIRVLNQVLVRSFDAIVVTSDFAHREFNGPASAVSTPLVKIPLGVDLATFRPHPELQEAHDGPLRLVHFGRLSREKSPHLAVATAIELHRRGVDIVMDVYGDGPHRHELEALAQGAPVTFHGHIAGRDELCRLIAAGDISLSVCPGETFGLAVLEALASGTPVVTANVGGARELITEACGAWASATPSDLADAVLSVAALPTDQRRAAARARAEEFPWATTVEQMLALHQSLHV